MFSLFIARRYFFARKRHLTTGIISVISVCGVALATAALVVTLSVFNGFREMVASFFNFFILSLKFHKYARSNFVRSDSSKNQL